MFPAPHTHHQVAQAIHGVLTEVANEAAITTGWCQRQGKLTGASFVQTLVFASMDQPAVTTEALARMSGTVGTPVTGPGLVQRCTPQAVALLLHVLEAAVATLIAADSVMQGVLHKVTGVYVLDSTIIPLPDALAEQWRGCGGSGPQAALKIHALWDLCRGTLAGLELVEGYRHDAASQAQRILPPPGSVRVADLGYVNRRVWQQLSQAGVMMVSRVKTRMKFTDRSGQPVDLLTLMHRYPQHLHDLPLMLDEMPCRVIAFPVSAEVATTRRSRLKLSTNRRGQRISDAQWQGAEWTLLVTTASQEQLTAHEVIALYRARWQIELLFKLWKEHGKLDEVRSQQPWRVACEVLAKLVGLVIEHWLLVLTSWSFPNRSLCKVICGIQSYAVALALAISSVSAMVEVLRHLCQTLRVGSRLNPRTRSPATYQLLANATLAFPAHLLG